MKDSIERAQFSISLRVFKIGKIVTQKNIYIYSCKHMMGIIIKDSVAYIAFKCNVFYSIFLQFINKILMVTLVHFFLDTSVSIREWWGWYLIYSNTKKFTTKLARFSTIRLYVLENGILTKVSPVVFMKHRQKTFLSFVWEPLQAEAIFIMYIRTKQRCKYAITYILPWMCLKVNTCNITFFN